jgi:hypothetical protein
MISIYSLGGGEPLLPALTAALPCIATDPESYQLAREQPCHAISLVRLPPDVLLHGGHHCVLSLPDGPITELLTHGMRGANPAVPVPAYDASGATVIEDEVVLLTRYGHGTWGHWLGEILPMAAVLELFHPGRYRFALPFHPVDWYRARLYESLTFYGIAPDRRLELRPTRGPYVFRNARMVTPIWTRLVPHPGAIAVLRHRVPTERSLRLALMRRDWSTRQMVNVAAVAALLDRQGFVMTDLAHQNFADQVRLFARAERVFGILGSGLTGLIYAPPGVRVIAAAPEGWRDGFFHGIAQVTGARCWTEIRGPSQWDGKTGLMRDAPFEVPLDHLASATAQTSEQ